MISPNKNPGLRPTGVGEVFRRIAGKVVMNILKKDVMNGTGSPQYCAGVEAGAETTICAMYDIYNDEQLEAVLLVDAENAFNTVNRNIMLHTTSVLCPLISTYVSNFCQSAARLFVISGEEILSKAGTTQGVLTSTITYALGVTPILHFLHEFILIKKHRS